MENQVEHHQGKPMLFNRNQLKPNNRSPYRNLARLLSLLLALPLTAFAGERLSANESGDYFELLCQLVQQVDDKDTRDYASARLTEMSIHSKDANLPYLHALALLRDYKYKDAVAPARLAIEQGSCNPDAWKLSIWLTITTEKDLSGGLANMLRLARLLNAENSPLQADQVEALRVADFLGRVSGFLAGLDELNALDLSIAQSEMRSLLTTEQQDYFAAAQQSVLDEFVDRLDYVADARDQARMVEDDIRNRRLSDASAERSYLRDQMDFIEQHRMQAREISANERNHIAANRGAGYSRQYGYRNGVLVRGHSRIRYGNNHGLGDRHYANVNNREAEFNNYLSDREQNLRRRLNRLAQDDERMLRRENTGNSRHARSSQTKATSLRTYVPLPIDVKSALTNLLASYH